MNDLPTISIRDQGALDFVRTLLREGINVRIKVSGESMMPLIQSGDLVEISSLKGKNPRLGDIVLFCTPQKSPLIHRLLRRRCYSNVLYLQTKGDACRSFDCFIPVDHLVGRVQNIITRRKKIDLRSPFMRLQSFRIVACALLSYYLRKATSSIIEQFPR
ncbi:MAG: S24/S26 family peptidase [Candidatus Electrothrix sp. GW3-4]|uniref:S24/S26 family peptidase n=1 Tax=Candidatus Electrothrix sp. GW3-4 TaxID=3126740 RepID=UPI0030D1579E